MSEELKPYAYAIKDSDGVEILRLAKHVDPKRLIAVKVTPLYTAPAAPKPQEPESIEDAMQYKCDDPECIVCATPKESGHD